MSARSKIEWTNASWNPVRARVDGVETAGWHCEHVSEGCRNCYAESVNKRFGTGLDYKPGNRDRVEHFLDEKMLLAPLKWRKPSKIFVGSTTDLFGEWVKDEWLCEILKVMRDCPRHTFQVLSKRPARMREFIAHAGEIGIVWPLPNVWLGVSCEDQVTAYERIPDLLATPAAVWFVSVEPMLGPVDLEQWLRPRSESISCKTDFTKLNWVICGGESGPHARPMNPAWARSLRDQCAAPGVPFFFKQQGEWAFLDGWETWHAEREPCLYRWPDGESSARAGKKLAGRLLDGKEHNGFPVSKI